MKKCQTRAELATLFSGMDEYVYEKVDSFNGQNCVTPETAIIIVGTLTPSGGKGYFYTAPYNKIYSYIDAARGTKLVEKKKLLQDQTMSNADRQQIICAIKEELISQKIAFLDVVECAIRRKGSYADKDIKVVTLDYNAFAKIPENVKIICNSRLAESCYNDIKAKIGNLPEAVYLTQWRAKKASWIDALQ